MSERFFNAFIASLCVLTLLSSFFILFTDTPLGAKTVRYEIQRADEAPRHLASRRSE